MKKYKTETVEKQTVESITCNKCGSECDSVYGNYFPGLFTGGYTSKLGDGHTVDFDLCEVCLIDLIKSFKIEPNKDCRDDECCFNLKGWKYENV